jgi:hypothetical protein
MGAVLKKTEIWLTNINLLLLNIYMDPLTGNSGRTSADKKTSVDKEMSSWTGNVWSYILIILSLIFSVALCYLLSRPEKTPLENFLESAGMLVFSSLASFLVSKMLSEVSYTKTLRDHGVQIASNIMMLKNQTRNLARWVVKKRSFYEENSIHDAELDHIQETLQGFIEINDATLKGVAGIIGDAFAQYKSTMDQIAVVREKTDKETAEIQNKMQFAGAEEASVLQNKIEQIKTESEKTIQALSAQTRLPVPLPPVKKLFVGPCPHCGKANEFEMLHRPGQTNSFICKHCRGMYNAHIGNNDNVFTRPKNVKHPKKISDTGDDALAKPECLSGIKIQSVNEKPFLRSRDWIGSDKKFEIVKILRESQFRIDPTEVVLLCALFAKHDKRLRDAGMTRTPYGLLNAILADDSKPVSNSVVRIFIKILMQGDTFKFDEGNSNWRTPFSNNFEEEKLLEKFLEGTIKRIKRIRPIVEADAEWLCEILLTEDHKNKVESIKQLIKNVN